MANILIVEDEKNMQSIIAEYMQRGGHTCFTADDGVDALMILKNNPMDLMILDVMMPHLDGFSVCKMAREMSNLPIIMLTAKSEEEDKLKGYELGADDYITKPFNPLEVVARVKTQLRRCSKYNTSISSKESVSKTEYDIRGLVINKDSHKCFLFGKELSLTPIEFEILWYLCEHQGKVIPSEELFEAVWKEKYLNNNSTVMAHIGRLREKLNEPAKKPKFIKTVWGVGYEIE